MSPYGPENKYPYPYTCNDCKKEIFVQWSDNTNKEYATENLSWERGTNGAIFHKCWNWKKGKATPLPETRIPLPRPGHPKQDEPEVSWEQRMITEVTKIVHLLDEVLKILLEEYPPKAGILPSDVDDEQAVFE